MNGFVDLDVTLRLPGAPDDETVGALARAAVAGGVDVVVVGIDGAAPMDADSLQATTALLRAGSVGGPCFVAAVTPLLPESRGGPLTDLSSLPRRAPATTGLLSSRPVWRLMSPVDDALLLRRVGEVARAHDAVVLVPSLDGSLARGGIAFEGALATRLGLAGVPEAAEALAVARIIEIARLTGACFHVLGVSTAAGAALLASAPALVTGSARASHLLVDERALQTLPYNTRVLRAPPLPTARSRIALVDAVRAGTLMVGSGHAHVPRRERDLEMSRATPGGTALSSTARLLAPVLGVEALVRAWRDGPRRLLGLPPLTDDVDAALVRVGGGHDDDLATLASELRP